MTSIINKLKKNVAKVANSATHVVEAANKEVQKLSGRNNANKNNNKKHKHKKQNNNNNNNKGRMSAMTSNKGDSFIQRSLNNYNQLDNNMSIERNNARIRGIRSGNTERFGVLLGNTGNAVIPFLNGGSLQIIHVTPANKALHPMESYQAQLYQQYSIKKFKIRYATELYSNSSSSAIAGKVILCANSDPDAVAPSSDIQMENLRGAISSPAPVGITFDLLAAYPEIRRKRYYMDPTIGSDSKFTIAATLFLTSLQTAVSNAYAVGELYVDYEYEYYDRVTPPVGLSSINYFFNSQSTTPTTTSFFNGSTAYQQFPPGGTLSGDGALGSSSVLFSFNANNIVFFPQLGVGVNWIITTIFTGVFSSSGTIFSPYATSGVSQVPSFATSSSETYYYSVSNLTTSISTFSYLQLTQGASMAFGWSVTPTSLSSVTFIAHIAPTYSVSSHKPRTTLSMYRELSEKMAGSTQQVEEIKISCMIEEPVKSEGMSDKDVSESSTDSDDLILTVKSRSRK